MEIGKYYKLITDLSENHHSKGIATNYKNYDDFRVEETIIFKKGTVFQLSAIEGHSISENYYMYHKFSNISICYIPPFSFINEDDEFIEYTFNYNDIWDSLCSK